MLHGPALVFLLRLPETTLMVGSPTTRQGVDPVSQVLFANALRNGTVGDEVTWKGLEHLGYQPG